MKKSKWIKIIIAWLLVLVWEGVIYYFSSANGEESRETSRVVVLILNKILQLDISNQNILDIFTFIVRKGAHMSEYFILMIFVFHAAYLSFQSYYMPSIVIVFLLASFDEFHQLFVAERSGQIRDVFVDLSGGLIALLLIYLIRKWIVNKRKRIE